MSNLTSNTISLLGGAALGAVVAYVLDPDRGESRRRQLAEKANSLSHYAQQLTDQVSSRATAAVGNGHHAANQAQQEISGSIQSLIERAKDYLAHAAERGHAAVDDLSNRAKKSVERQTGWEPAHSHHSGTGITLEIFGAIALGAGTMYFFDPQHGRDRRGWAQDKIFGGFRRTEKWMGDSGRQMGNQLKKAAAEAKDAMPPEWSKAAERATNAVENAAENMTPKAGDSK